MTIVMWITRIQAVLMACVLWVLSIEFFFRTIVFNARGDNYSFFLRLSGAFLGLLAFIIGTLFVIRVWVLTG